MALQEELELQGNWLFRYRSILPLIILAIGTLLYLYTELHPDTFFIEETSYEGYYELACLFICLFGLGIRIYTIGHTPANTSGRNAMKGQLADSLNTTGIYSVVRHPLYLGNFFMWLGIAFLTGNFWFTALFCLLYWIYYERIMFAEEQFLRNKFGAEYIQWAANVPAFVPNLSLKNFKKPLYPFSWRKVLKKEKNGLAAVFLIFSFFDIIGEIAEGRSDYNYWLLAMNVATGLLYLILKYLKKYTDVLNEEGR